MLKTPNIKERERVVILIEYFFTFLYLKLWIRLNNFVQTKKYNKNPKKDKGILKMEN